jgi:hypothetical protein
MVYVYRMTIARRGMGAEVCCVRIYIECMRVREEHRLNMELDLQWNRVSVSAHSAGAYTATLLVMVNVVKGGGRAPPTLTSQANFTLMMECTPEAAITTLCTLWLRRCNSSPPPPQHLGSYARALWASQDRRHLFVTPWGRATRVYSVYIKVWLCE